MGELKNRVARYLLLEEDGIVAAYGGMWVLYEESHMTNIAVAPEYRGRGYGRILFFAMMAEAQKRGGFPDDAGGAGNQYRSSESVLFPGL